MKDGTDFMRFIRIADIEMPSTELVNSKIFNLWKDRDGWNGGWKHQGTKDGNSHTDYYRKNEDYALLEFLEKVCDTVNQGVVDAHAHHHRAAGHTGNDVCHADDHTAEKLIDQVFHGFLSFPKNSCFSLP